VIQEADGADDVGELVSEWIVERWADTGQRGKVDYRVEGLLGELSLANVAHLEPNTVRQWFLRRQLVESRHLVSHLVEMPYDMVADEAR
jgi:hypothetical protein